METKDPMAVRPSTPTASARSLTPTVSVLWSTSALSAPACGHVQGTAAAHTEFVGLLAGPLAGVQGTSVGVKTADVIGVGGKGTGSTVGIGGNGRSYAVARLIPAMSEAVSVKPATARQRRAMDVPGGIPPRGRPD